MKLHLHNKLVLKQIIEEPGGYLPSTNEEFTVCGWDFKNTTREGLSCLWLR